MNPIIPMWALTGHPTTERLLSELENVVKIRVLAYHNYAGSKYLALGMENTLPERVPSAEEISAAVELFKTVTNKEICN